MRHLGVHARPRTVRHRSSTVCLTSTMANFVLRNVTAYFCFSEGFFGVAPANDGALEATLGHLAPRTRARRSIPPSRACLPRPRHMVCRHICAIFSLLVTFSVATKNLVVSSYTFCSFFHHTHHQYLCASLELSWPSALPTPIFQGSPRLPLLISFAQRPIRGYQGRHRAPSAARSAAASAFNFCFPSLQKNHAPCLSIF
jgi:hypothetical protein